MAGALRLALAQAKVTVGDLDVMARGRCWR